MWLPFEEVCYEETDPCNCALIGAFIFVSSYNACIIIPPAHADGGCGSYLLGHDVP
jgi:hypothetical protein